MAMDFDQLRNLIAQNKTERVFDALKEYSKTNPEVATLSAKFTDVKRKENIGLIDTDDAFKIRSQVNYGVLELINEIEKNEEAGNDKMITNGGSPSTTTLPPVAMVNQKTVFISYNHNDAEIANRLKERLRAEQIDVTIDSEKMIAGSDIKEFIEGCVRDTKTTISLVSKKSLLSAWVAMESINTFYNEKTDLKKKFIACYIDDDFFNRDFTDNALDTIDEQVKEIRELIKRRMEKNRNDRDLRNELDRWLDLQNNIDKIIGRLRESLCIDIRNENFENNFNKILKAINS